MPVFTEPPQPTLSERAVTSAPAIYENSISTRNGPREILRITVPPRVRASAWFDPVVARSAQRRRFRSGGTLTEAFL